MKKWSDDLRIKYGLEYCEVTLSDKQKHVMRKILKEKLLKAIHLYARKDVMLQNENNMWIFKAEFFKLLSYS